ncbi:restriction endonuclease subunit S [Streptomyces sp. A0592]|nr:restriction endonuclease subunit S [Streptomyces sp. A0592]
MTSVNARIGWKALTAAEYQPQGFTFLSTPNIKGREIDFENVNYITEFRYQESPELKLREGDVLLVKDGNTLGIVNLVKYLPRPATVNGSIALIRPTGIDGAFLRYVLESRVTQAAINMLKGGMGVPHLFQWDINRLPIPVPPLEEQRRIADFLDSETARIDRLADRYQKLSDLAVERARAVIDKALIGFSAEFSVPASAVCSAIVDCVNKTAPTSAEATPYKMIRTSNIRNGDVDLSETFSVERPVFIEWNRRGAPRNGDILFTREAPLGQVGMLRTDTSVFLGQRIILYRANENVIKKELLLYNFLGSHMDRQFRLLGAGSLHEHMRVGDCLKLRIYCPPRTQQDVLVAEIEAGRAKSLHLAKLAKRQLALLAERRQALITAAVTGQFDVSTASGRNVTDGVTA